MKRVELWLLVLSCTLLVWSYNPNQLCTFFQFSARAGHWWETHLGAREQIMILVANRTTKFPSFICARICCTSRWGMRSPFCSTHICFYNFLFFDVAPQKVKWFEKNHFFVAIACFWPPNTIVANMKTLETPGNSWISLEAVLQEISEFKQV